MKKLVLYALCSVGLFAGAGCTNMRVVHTDVATGVVNPKAIYIRPFEMAGALYRDEGNPNGGVAKSLAPVEFANMLQEQMGKIAPSMVLMEDEVPVIGWLVEGHIEVLDSGVRGHRALPLFGSVGRAGASTMVVHVKITDMRSYPELAPIGKDLVEATGRDTLTGRVVYEFDVAGGDYFGGPLGTISTPGLGHARPFDMRNTAERIMLALSPDAFRYGARTSPIARN